MNGPVKFLSKGEKVHPWLRDTNLVTRYVFPEGYCMFFLKHRTWMMRLGMRW